MSLIIILNNFPAHRVPKNDGFREANGITDTIILFFLIMNVTCRYQLMDIGIIACFIIGYYVQLLEYFLKLFDIAVFVIFLYLYQSRNQFIFFGSLRSDQWFSCTSNHGPVVACGKRGHIKHKAAAKK